MISLAVFCLAAALIVCLSRLKPWRERRADGPRLEGVVFVGAVLLAALVGLLWQQARGGGAASGLGFGQGVSSAATGPSGVMLLGLTGALYLACVLRGKWRLPAWLADVALVVATSVAVYLLDAPTIDVPRLPFIGEYVRLGAWAGPLTVFWMWAVARTTAALNRTPQVSGGYLGVVALTLLLAFHFSSAGARTNSAFPPLASAALAGAGLASVPVALRFGGSGGFNLGWPAVLAMGFLLAQIAVVGLFKNMTLAMLAMLGLALGLPFLDVSFYRLRAAGRGEKVAWEQRRLRLHQALSRRGISNAKISLLYLSIAAYLCGLGTLLVALGHWHLALRLLIVAPLLGLGFIVFFSLTRVLMRKADGEEIPEDVEAFGVRISPVSMTQAMDKIEEFIHSRQPHHVVTSDANSILRAQDDPEYAAIVRRAALITPDGYGVMWGARLLNLPIYERVTGVDMVSGICERAARNGYSIYILGSAPGVASSAAGKLAQRYPGLKVAGTQHGYFKPEEEDAVVRAIALARPDVLFVAFGIPRQEKFIVKHFHAMNVPVALGVGGSFDVYSEKLKRAPEYIQRSGMEWLYRVWQEPWRWKRMSYVPRFVLLALRVWLFGPTRAQRNSKPVL